ncbi:hypothetical protein GQ473_01360 [archaeon]|nr:hypothetical protein [archaeon]
MITGTGTIRANGGNGGDSSYDGGGGAGGRIAIYCISTIFGGTTSVYGGTGYNVGGEGTIYWDISSVSYPSNVDAFVNSSQIYNGAGTLSTSVPMPDFSSEINNYLLSCTPDGEGYCDVPLIFEFVGAGNLSVSGLSVTYTLPGAKAQATVTSEGLEDTMLKNFWFASTTGDICMLNSAEIPLTIGDMYIGRNTSCGITCGTFSSVRATTTCGTSDEFTGTPNGC